MSETKWSVIATKANPKTTDNLLIIDNEANPIVNKLITIASLPVGIDNQGTNLGTGSQVYKDNSGTNLQFRSLTGTTNKITLTQSDEEINFNLGSLAVLTNQTNTFDAFAQIFPTTQLQIKSTSSSSVFQILSTGINTNRQITLPLLTANDTFVMVAFGQTLTNKTLTEPTIGDFTKAIHNHSADISGGKLTNSALTAGPFDSIEGIGPQNQTLDMDSEQIIKARLPTDTNFFVDPTTTTKRFGFAASLITGGQTRTITVPDEDLRLISTTTGLVDLGNMTNKLTGQLISYSATGNAVAVGAGSNTQVLTSVGGSNVPQFQDVDIVNSQVNNSALIDYSKLGALPTGDIVFGNAGTATPGTMSGDMTISNTGIVTAANAIIFGKTIKNAPIGDDEALLSDSADSNNLKKFKLNTLPPSGILMSSYQTDPAANDEFFAASGGAVTGDPTFIERAAPIPITTTVSRLTVNADQAPSANVVFTLFKNAVAQASTVTILTTTGSFTDVTNTTSLSSGDLIAYGIVGNANTVCLAGASCLLS